MAFQITRTTRRIFLLAVIFILGGCAGGVNMLPTLAEKNLPKTEEGVVVVRVINASAYPLPFNQFTITPKNLNESKNIKPSRLEALPIVTTNSTIFSAPVKSGSYSLSSVRAFHVRGDYWYSRWAGADAQFGTFEVEPGKVTDLGTVIYYPKPEKDKYINTLLRHPVLDKGKTLKEHFSFYSFDDEQVITWAEDDYQEQRDSLYASIAQNPVTFNKKYLAPDNTMYFIGKLGVIMYRTPEKDWELDAVDTDYDLVAIKQSPNGALVVGGDEGVIFYKIPDGDWQNISIDNSHHIEDFYFSSDNKLTAVSRQEKKLHIMSLSLNSDKPQWQTLTTFDYINGWKNTDPLYQIKEEENTKKKTKKTKKKTKRIVSAELSQYKGEHIIAIKYQPMRQNIAFGVGDILTFKYDPKTWQVVSFENEVDIDREFNAGAAKLGVEYAGFWSWTSKPSYYKLDKNSKNWHEIATSIKSCKSDSQQLKGDVCVDNTDNKPIKAHNDAFSFTSIPWFSSNENGVAIASFSDYSFWTGQRNNETKIIKTQDGGKSWQITDYKLPNKYCTQIVNEVQDSILLSCNGVSSDFYESNDNGQTWQLVREQESF